ncbi:hypothetical protein TWF569_003155 [Orbilia oligospora]|uniref:Uncharacterized protein n=1 Tax=Orbilia oligospora TaxID=2813651 RepID=A0A7C8P6J5_ORBOL|nr:hypothetical protein TWF102_010628 [Orbilia oligospora]KAF3100490.1 hypothetical protein TWF103_008213 [Orbilia oligospora]KAF3110932.1 hypothetical protein TWF706_000394 [Orbilia oligospora]KAF3120417.1 hypothetical protein TWF569_003155 [Orbilia oligospora]KAF3135451.1 hypothetical protein TWF703_005995 [Orbilia oligospora]
MQNQEQPVSVPAPTYSSAPAMEMTPQSRTQQDSQREAEPKVQLGLRGGRDRGCLAGW